MKMNRLLLLFTIPFLLSQGVAAQIAADQSQGGQPSASTASELAKQTQNPIASLISFPLETNFDMGIGERQSTSTLLNIQPVVPFPISKGTNIILRVIMPMKSSPSSVEGGNRTNGIGDILVSAFFTASKSGSIIWGIGPVLALPSATNDALGSEKFSVGPTAVVLTQPGKWTFGLLANQLWSTSGAIDRDDVNRMYLQPFMHYNLGSGLSVGASAEMTGNWKADNEKWSGPLLFDVSKVTKLGARPTKFKLGVGPYFGPNTGPDWRFRFAVYFLFPH
jgi:hypothetical protein